MNNEPFVIEKVYNSPIDKVWKAITDKDQMKEWYFTIATFEPKVGFEFSFEGKNEDRTFLHLCKIVEVKEKNKLKYSWRYDSEPGNSFVTFELYTEGEKTRLKLTHEGLETFPQDKKDFARESFAQGWTHIVGTSLRKFVEE